MNEDSDANIVLWSHLVAYLDGFEDGYESGFAEREADFLLGVIEDYHHCRGCDGHDLEE